MNSVYIAAIITAALITSSCSKKSEPNHSKEFAAENTKPRHEVSPANTQSKSDSESAKVRESDAEPAGEEEEAERQPAAEEIGEDCVRFVRATKAAPANTSSGDCPTCPMSGENSEVLHFIGLQVDSVSCTEMSCDVAVTIRATFNPTKGGTTIVGGLTAWISPEQRAQYAQGQTPPGEQVFPVKVVYRKTAKGWSAVEFAR